MKTNFNDLDRLMSKTFYQHEKKSGNNRKMTKSRKKRLQIIPINIHRKTGNRIKIYGGSKDEIEVIPTGHTKLIAHSNY